jgi:hypothetical protein
VRFGSAGCDVDFRIEVGYDGPPLDPSVTYELAYEVKGGEEPLINTLTIEGKWPTNSPRFRSGACSTG